MNLYNYKQVIYLVRSPFNERDFKRFGIKNWINHGWEIKVFDITKLLNPVFWKEVDGDKLSFHFNGLSIFQSMHDLLHMINNLKNRVVFIDILGLSNIEMKIRNVAHAHGVIIKLKLGTIPEIKTSKKIFEFISLIKNPISFIQKSTSLIKNRVQKIKDEKYTDYLVVSGIKSMQGVNKKKTSIIKAHNLDYDFFIQHEHVKSNKKINYLLFLDEYGPYHSDFIHLGIKPYVSEDHYYSDIDRGLIEIAKSLKLTIKIAAHPRSNYAFKQKKYKHPILENQTFELVRDADVIVAHSSTALNWAVVMKKPIIFATTNEIQNEFYSKRYAKFINNFASILGKKVINLSQISRLKNFSDYLKIDDEKYEKYIENYIKTKGSPRKLVWDIVIEKIEKDIIL